MSQYGMVIFQLIHLLLLDMWLILILQEHICCLKLVILFIGSCLYCSRRSTIICNLLSCLCLLLLVGLLIIAIVSLI